MNQQPPRQYHRVGVLLALIVACVAWLIFTFPNPAMLTRQNLIALAVVILLTAVGGIAFSWGRYFRRR
jgi:O-antigen/teichoic acid export membrane protein